VCMHACVSRCVFACVHMYCVSAYLSDADCGLYQTIITNGKGCAMFWKGIVLERVGKSLLLKAHGRVATACSSSGVSVRDQYACMSVREYVSICL